MAIRSFVITILIVALAILHSGETKKCYQCDSRKSESCTNDPSSIHEVECFPQRCGHCSIAFPNDTKLTIRGCLSLMFDTSPYFYQLQQIDNGFCSVCNEDLCNNANMATISMTALGCLVSFWAIRSVLTNVY